MRQHIEASRRVVLEAERDEQMNAVERLAKITDELYLRAAEKNTAEMRRRARIAERREWHARQYSKVPQRV